jgi:hypothetical protein
MKTNILVAGIRKDNDRETAKSSDSSSPLYISDFASICHCVSLAKVIDNEDDKIPNRDQGNDAGILERVKSA